MVIEPQQHEQMSYGDMVRDTPSDFRVCTRIYTDPQIFEDEIRNVFEKTWIYVGHESEVASAGDYRTAYIGRQPLIVSRGEDGQVRVLMNSCRHRGNVLCREERGTAKFYRCSYHGWVYRNDGLLATIPERSAYPEGFESEIGGLATAPRVAVYRGLIFASLSPEGESIEEHLGEVRDYVDLWVERSPEGRVRVLRPHRTVFPANWKFQSEQDADGYHGRYVHQSAFNTRERFAPPEVREDTDLAVHGTGNTRGFAGGHAVLEKPGTRGGLPSALLEEYRERLVRAYGVERARRISMVRHVLVFPNLYLMDDHLRVHYPVSVDRTEAQSFPTFLGDVPDEVNRLRLKNLQRGHSQAGFVGTDDVEMFLGCHTGMRAAQPGWIVLNRGLNRESAYPTGERVAESSDETPQRAIHREWARRMSQG